MVALALVCEPSSPLSMNATSWALDELCPWLLLFMLLEDADDEYSWSESWSIVVHRCVNVCVYAFVVVVNQASQMRVRRWSYTILCKTSSGWIRLETLNLHHQRTSESSKTIIHHQQKIQSKQFTVIAHSRIALEMFIQSITIIVYRACDERCPLWLHDRMGIWPLIAICSDVRRLRTALIYALCVLIYSMQIRHLTEGTIIFRWITNELILRRHSPHGTGE